MQALLEPLALRRPDDLDVLVASYRCARYEPGAPRLAATAAAVFACPARGTAELRAQKEVYDDAMKASGGRLVLAPERQVALVARRWGNGLDGVFRSVDVTLSAMASDHARPTVLIPFDFLDGGLASECAPSAGAMGRFGIMTPRTTA